MTSAHPATIIGSVRHKAGYGRFIQEIVRALPISASFLLVVLTATSARARQNFKVLLSFGGANGANPDDGLLQGLDGNLYGTTFDGGGTCGIYCGTIFKITPTGMLTTLHNFCGQPGCADGANPFAGLVQATNGNFYGTTEVGGESDAGTIFKITPGGSFTVLQSLDFDNGAYPLDGLALGLDGNFYGTTQQGGEHPDGLVFKITPTGTLTTLYSFCSRTNCVDGAFPGGELVLGPDGNFYGTTAVGGSYNDPTLCQGGPGCGTVFKITPTGTLTTLYSFCAQANCSDGALPVAGVVLATDGSFYGTTRYGGANGDGTVFKLAPTGALVTLYSFCSQTNCTDGSTPWADLIQATDGNLYGTTTRGGVSSDGTVFRITPQGRLTTLHSFDGNDGDEPYGGLVQATNGTFFGTTSLGGSDDSCSVSGGCGTIFALSTGLGPFVEMLPAWGKVGAAIRILGTNLMGATSVTFNGTPAKFTVNSGSSINATVPAGATTGTVQVVTPGRTLSSNVPFKVMP